VTVRIGLHQADAFDTADLGDLAPRPLAEINLGMIEAERLYRDDDVTGFRFRIRTPLQRQHLRSPVLLDNDGPHNRTPWLIECASLMDCYIQKKNIILMIFIGISNND
jgi:hypothetical protein